MKILYITTIGATMRFFVNYICQLMEAGHQVDIACGEPGSLPQIFIEKGCSVHAFSYSRSPLKISNIIAVKEVKKLVQNEKYDIVHCHTPIAAACTRLACRTLRKKGTKVIYTAHGFHFYTGAPLLNWVIYYPIEWITSWYTDVLITINKEDYARAKNRFHAKQILYVPGVGIDTDKFRKNKEDNPIREELEISGKAFVLLSVGELNENKNHEAVIRAIAGMHLVYVIVGEGRLKEQLENVAKEVGSNVILTGYRTDIIDFYNTANAFILPSIREGLNVSLMEAMASGLPCLAGDIRGNRDLIDEKGGCLFNPSDINEISKAIESIMSNPDGKGQYNQEKIKSYDYGTVNMKMNKIYFSETDQQQ